MIRFTAVGDVGPERPDVDSLFEKVAAHVRAADIAFMQLEMTLTQRGQRVPQTKHTSRTHPDAAAAFRRAGFTHAGWASNHSLDWGTEGFFDTIDALDAASVVPLGVGRDLSEARRIRIAEADGIRVAILAYCSILPADYWATAQRPGVAPLRAFTVHEPIEPDQPGTPARMHTFPHPDDLSGMVADIRAAREIADAVIVSAHWGIHFSYAELADYQRVAGRAAIDAGADLVIGHHAHILKGVEMYRGKAIFHSLGNFAIELPMDEEHAQRPSFRHLLSLHPGWEPDIGGMFNFPPDSRKSIIVDCDIDERGVSGVRLRPVWIDRMAVPEILAPDDPRFAEVVDYLRGASSAAGLDTTFTVDGDEVRVS
ncbi:MULTISPECIES: CapA family protein [Microbacterium]|uniref:CapA family protein n=1 Tax=Microbacterium wangchenii TaxID=2541726 RepID=A0ABX5SSH1_9MICO|nr:MULTISPECIES: CapA family protein [Microbacterium]MCK6068055.1 CapA family protein [Microbacterium sp. EYE_512]QBR87815.1 CapA family protein [Microbacterium wangchenii]TFV84063.1 CapA family protein [Microbacterium sp. dk485]TXK16108.1 CapA family protein [Microbacterium wangchenii]